MSFSECYLFFSGVFLITPHGIVLGSAQKLFFITALTFVSAQSFNFTFLNLQHFYYFLEGLICGFVLSIPWYAARYCGAILDFSKNITAAGQFDPQSIEQKTVTENIFANFAAVWACNVYYLQTVIVLLLNSNISILKKVNSQVFIQYYSQTFILLILVATLISLVEYFQFFLGSLFPRQNFSTEILYLKALITVSIWSAVPSLLAQINVTIL